MSLIAVGMNVLLAGLLVAAMVVGVRLNRRLKALRDSHDGFEAAVRELNLAAVRAEQGLADLRAATDEATDLLSDRIEKGRTLAARLEKLAAAAPELPRAATERAQRAMPAVTPPARAAATEDRLASLLAMARQRLSAQEEPEAQPALLREAEPLVGRTPLPGRRVRPSIDDDLFEDAPLALDRFAGARR